MYVTHQFSYLLGGIYPQSQPFFPASKALVISLDFWLKPVAFTWAVLIYGTNIPTAVWIAVEYCNSLQYSTAIQILNNIFFSLPVLLLKLWSEIFDKNHLLENANALACLAIHCFTQWPPAQASGDSPLIIKERNNWVYVVLLIFCRGGFCHWEKGEFWGGCFSYRCVVLITSVG